jgi:hypothetical protein
MTVMLDRSLAWAQLHRGVRSLLTRAPPSI